MESRTKYLSGLLLFKNRIGLSLVAHPFVQLFLLGAGVAVCLICGWITYFEIAEFRESHVRFSLLQAKQRTFQQFKEQERIVLEKLQLADRFYLDKRLDFRLIDEHLRKGDLFQEIETRQEHPIELNEHGLKTLLELIETMPQGSPQLVVKRLHLSKKKLSPQRSLFIADINLIKREKPHS